MKRRSLFEFCLLIILNGGSRQYICSNYLGTANTRNSNSLSLMNVRHYVYGHYMLMRIYDYTCVLFLNDIISSYLIFGLCYRVKVACS